MELHKIISISGQGSLFKIVAQAKFGLIAESLVDKKRIPVYANQKVSTLNDISIYGEENDKPLREIFISMFENGTQTALPIPSNNEDLRNELGKYFPEFDRERVFVSDIKKLFKWFNQLVESGEINAENLKKEETEEVAESIEDVVATKTKPKADVKKTSKPKAATPKAQSAPKGGVKNQIPRKAS